MIKHILITGGAGFIGSHTCLNLLENGYKILVLDSCINSSSNSLKKVLEILKNKNLDLRNSLEFIHGDINDFFLLQKIFKNCKDLFQPVDAVIHFAGLKSVNESIEKPLEYWNSNVCGTINLLRVMKQYNCKKIIFSSSASIYGSNNNQLIHESSEIKPTNPYGSTKVSIEKMLEEVFYSDKENWAIINLRYFNPIGAHDSGLIGEEPKNKPNNIFPMIIDVAVGNRPYLTVFGNDWETYDGTCVRDFIHVMDLADAHVKALEYIKNKNSYFLNLNVGTGKGTSILELVKTFQEVNKIKIEYCFSDRRKGDVSHVVADNSRALSLLNWCPRKNVEDMCRDGWRWKVQNLN